MPNKTANYNLIKPLGSEHYDINVHNGNMDIIDEELKRVTECNNKRIDEIENEFKDSNLEVFKTEVQTTKLDGCTGGFINVDKIEGRTLVNLFSNPILVDRLEPDFAFTVDYLFRFANNGVFTFVNKSNKDVSLPINKKGTWIGNFVGKANTNTLITITEGDVFRIDFHVAFGWQKSDKSNFKKEDFMLLEGDWTNKSITSYFECIKSVGEPITMGSNLNTPTTIYYDSTGAYYTVNRMDNTNIGSAMHLNTLGKNILIINNKPRKIRVDIYNNSNAFLRSDYVSSNSNKNIQLNINELAPAIVGLVADGWNDTNKEELKQIELKEVCSYRIEILSQGGKNLFLKDGMQRKYIHVETGALLDDTTRVSSDYLNVSPNTTYTISINSSNFIIRTVQEYTSSKQNISSLFKDGTTTNTVTFTTSTNTKYIVIAFAKTNLTDTITLNELNNANIQLEQGTIATTYEPYKGDETEILTTHPLREMDSIDINGVITRGSGQVVFNGNEDWKVSGLNDYTKYNFSIFWLRYNGVKKADNLNSIEVICDKLPSISTYDTNQFGTNDKVGVSTYTVNSDEIRIKLSNNMIGITNTDNWQTATQKFKTWLSQNPVTLVYQLATPTQENTNKTLNLRAYENLLVNAGEIQPEVTYSYPKNTGERFVTIEDTVNSVKGNVDDINKNFEEKIKEINIKTSNIKVPVTKVNGKDGDIVLSASDIKNSEGKTLEMKAIELNNLQNTLNAVNSTLNSLKSTIDSINNKVSTMQNTIWIGQ